MFPFIFLSLSLPFWVSLFIFKFSLLKINPKVILVLIMVSTRNQKKQSHPSSDHQKWEIIFNALQQMLRKQSSQIDVLLEQRQSLQERIQLQYQRWNSDVRFLEDIIAQKERQLSLSESEKRLEISKADFLLASKKREALVNNRKLENARSELDDFKAWFDILSHKCPDKEDITPNRIYESLKTNGGGQSGHISSNGASKHQSKLEKEVATLKQEYEKLSVKHMSETSALKDENKFVWNQYKTMEGKYSDQLKTKNDEVAQANEKITNLLNNMEQLQSANVEKDETVATLRAKVTKLEAEVNKKDGDISRLTKELELLTSKNTDGVPLLNQCSTEFSSSGLKVRRSSRQKEIADLNEEATAVQLRATISSLRAKLIELEAGGNPKSEENFKLSKESKLLSSKTPTKIPVLKRCMNELSSSRDRGMKGGTAAVEEESSSMQLEATIATLKDKISELEAQSNLKNEEISALSKELKLMKSKSAADTPPVLNQSRPSSSRPRGRENSKNCESASLKEQASSSQLVTKQSGSRSKRKRDIISIEETPKLFTSQFKIPKLRSQSPRGR
ncbi:paramyosin-like isoform X2 [Chenopodium quinoa]|uniref:Uncharacterized protein n=1 Tax=Chenopodium quinoa TaxID=63459 RepID=A0A803N808_CHEQI|nr:paramyosin-like isoform X2 [Chenopodium quinoa]